MAIRYFRIGSMENVVGYDDATYDSAIETDQPIKAGDPIDPTDVVNLRSMGMARLDVANIDAPAEITSIAGVPGQSILAYQENAGAIDEWTIYAYDDDGPGVDVPYVMDADGAGDERWVAIAGKYIVIDRYVKGDFHLVTYASRLAWFDATGKLEQVDIDNFIAGTGSEITVIDDGDGTVTLEGAGSDVVTDVVTAIQAGGAGGVGFQYKTRQFSISGGIASVGVESGWNDV